MTRVIFFNILLLFAFQNVVNAQGDGCAAYSNMRRVNFRLAADMPNGMEQPFLYKKQLQFLLSEDQFQTYNNARACYIGSIPLLSVGTACAAWGVFFFVGGIASGIQGDDWSSGFLMLLSAPGFIASVPFLIPGVNLIVNSKRKLNKIANDFNSRHYQSNLQIQCGFVGNGIGIKLSF